jgi:hypothetical protein
MAFLRLKVGTSAALVAGVSLMASAEANAADWHCQLTNFHAGGQTTLTAQARLHDSVRETATLIGGSANSAYCSSDGLGENATLSCRISRNRPPRPALEGSVSMDSFDDLELRAGSVTLECWRVY